MPYRYNIYLMGQSSSIHSIIQVLREVTALVDGNYLHFSVQMRVLRFKVFIFISPTVPWHMMTPSESIFLLWLYIDSLTGVWMSVMLSIIQMYIFMKESVSVHHPIIWTVLKNITPMFLSIDVVVGFVFNA